AFAGFAFVALPQGGKRSCRLQLSDHNRRRRGAAAPSRLIAIGPCSPPGPPASAPLTAPAKCRCGLAAPRSTNRGPCRSSSLARCSPCAVRPLGAAPSGTRDADTRASGLRGAPGACANLHAREVPIRPRGAGPRRAVVPHLEVQEIGREAEAAEAETLPRRVVALQGPGAGSVPRRTAVVVLAKVAVL